ncbi:ribosomal protein S18-alanine N-acetyltransferase [Gemmatimonas sp.]
MTRVPTGSLARLRDMQEDDLERVANIEARSFSDAWPASAFEELLAQSYARLRVVEDAAAEVQGYCVLLRAADEGEIANICTAPDSRGRGFGGLLLDDALAVADANGVMAVYLEVRTSNVAARALYESRGFTAVGRRRHYYQDPTEDALVLKRSHPSAPVGIPA